MKPVPTLLIALLGGIFALALQSLFTAPNASVPLVSTAIADSPVRRSAPIVPMLDFSVVATNITPAVVHIKTRVLTKTGDSSLIPDLLDGDNFSNRSASGSGVLISRDGHIVTNRHVIADANDIEVVLNDKRSYRAKLLGFDRSTDLAVLKISDTTPFPSINYGNSDKVRVGEWVMAVGNPFNLASTVTAGIVSAKARNIGILEDNTAIESFIQTDAAVNPGNSGGALVNANGELIGINTAIATPTGYFAGYSFAVPVNIVRKVVEDILRFGVVKRGFLGVTIREVDAPTAQLLGMNTVRGVYVEGFNTNSAAAGGGIRRGDVIVAVNTVPINSTSELQEHISRFHPGDAVTVTILRQQELKDLTVELRGPTN